MNKKAVIFFGMMCVIAIMLVVDFFAYEGVDNTNISDSVNDFTQNVVLHTEKYTEATTNEAVEETTKSDDKPFDVNVNIYDEDEMSSIIAEYESITGEKILIFSNTYTEYSESQAQSETALYDN